MYFTSRYDLLNSIHSFSISKKSSNYIEIKFILLVWLILTLPIYTSILYQNVKSFISVIYLCIYIFISVSLIISMLMEIQLNTNIKNELIFLVVYFVFFTRFIFNYLVLLLPYYSIWIIQVVLNLQKKIKIRYLLVHFLVFILLICAVHDSKSDLFLRTFNVCPNKIYLYTVDKNWFNMNFLKNDFFFNFKNKLENNVVLPNFFNNFIRYFVQNIQTNFFLNINYIDTNNNIYFFQKNLFLYSIVILYYLIKNHTHGEFFKKKVV